MNKLIMLSCAVLLSACVSQQPPASNVALQAQQGVPQQQAYYGQPTVNQYGQPIYPQQQYSQNQQLDNSGVGRVYGKPHQLRNAAVGAAVGAAIGQAWGQDTEGTVTGAAIGGLIGSQVNTLY